MSVESIGQIFGIALSLVMFYFPPFANWYNTFDKPQKALFMVGCIFGGLGVIFALSCFGLPLFGVACTYLSAFELLKLVVQIAIANQATYFLLVRPMKKARALRALPGR